MFTLSSVQHELSKAIIKVEQNRALFFIIFREFEFSKQLKKIKAAIRQVFLKGAIIMPPGALNDNGSHYNH